jgi:hypothetical protein
MIEVLVVGTMIVGVTVAVCCGPTVRLKSRSYAIGSASPLLLSMITDQAPLISWSFSVGLFRSVCTSREIKNQVTTMLITEVRHPASIVYPNIQLRRLKGRRECYNMCLLGILTKGQTERSKSCATRNNTFEVRHKGERI